MKQINLLSTVLLVALAMFSCDSDNDNDSKQIEPENHIEVGETSYSNIHLMLAYSGVRGENSKGVYPLTVYLYNKEIVYTNESGLVENAFAHIRMQLQVPSNGIPGEGVYTYNPESDDEFSIRSASQCTNRVGTQIISMDGSMSRLVDQFDGADLYNVTLSITHSEDDKYVFELKADDRKGNDVKAYFKGVVGRTIIY